MGIMDLRIRVVRMIRFLTRVIRIKELIGKDCNTRIGYYGYYSGKKQETNSEVKGLGMPYHQD